MEAPRESQLQNFSVSGKRSGSVDDSCGTDAQLMNNKIPLANFIYGLQSCRGHSVGRLCYQGPNTNNEQITKCFVGSIVSDFEYNDSANDALSLQVLLAFAINNLKELHSKQQSCRGKNKELYINAFLRPQDPIRNICQSFGLRKVDNLRMWYSSLGIYDPKGIEDCYDVYLLDPSTQQQAADVCKRFLLPASAITIETNSPELSDEKEKEDKTTQILSEVTPKIRKSPRLARKKS